MKWIKAKHKWARRLFYTRRPGKFYMELETQCDMISVAHRQGTTVSASIQGEIDLHNSPDLRQAMLHVLLAENTKSLQLNLQEVPYMDSSAVAVLVEGFRHIQKRKGEIILSNVQPRVKGLLQIARLDTMFTIHDCDSTGDEK